MENMPSVTFTHLNVQLGHAANDDRWIAWIELGDNYRLVAVKLTKGFENLAIDTLDTAVQFALGVISTYTDIRQSAEGIVETYIAPSGHGFVKIGQYWFVIDKHENGKHIEHLFSSSPDIQELVGGLFAVTSTIDPRIIIHTGRPTSNE